MGGAELPRRSDPEGRKLGKNRVLAHCEFLRLAKKATTYKTRKLL